jgi:DNA gyrase subunit A
MDDAKKSIMNMTYKKYKFTENQADYIVHTPLGRLANLEQVKLQDEKKELEKKKAINEDLLVNYKSQEKYFLKRFNSLIDKYAWERKTTLEDVEEEKVDVRTIRPKTLKPKKEYFIVLTDNALKRIEVSKYRSTDEDNKSIKVEGNQLVTMVTNMGNMYKVKSNNIDICLPTASGTDIKSIRPELKDGEKVLVIYSEDVNIPYIYFMTKCGLGKKAPIDVIKISKQVGATVCGLKTEGDEVIAVKLLNENENIEVTTNQRTEILDVVNQNVQAGRNANGKVMIRLKKDENITEIHSIS